MELKIKSRLRKGTQWALIGKAGAAVIGLCTNILLARLLSAEEMGTYFLALSLASIVAMLARFGTPSAAVRLIAEAISINDKPRAKAVASLTIRFVIASGAAFGLIMAVIGTDALGNHVFQSPALVSVAGLVGIWIYLMTYQSSIAQIFQGFHKIRESVIFGGILSSALVLLALFAVWLTEITVNLAYILAFTLAAMAISAGGSLILLKYKESLLWESKSSFTIRNLIVIATPMFITGSSSFILSQLDVMIVGAFRPEEEVALYGAAKRFVLLVTIPLHIIGAVLPPIIAQLNKQDRMDELESIMRSAATAAGLPAIIILIVIVFLAGPALVLMYGDYYQAASGILIVLALGQMVNVWGGACGFALNMTGHHKTLMVISLIIGLLVVAGSAVCASKYGGIGVACMVGAGYAAQNIAMVLVTHKKVGIWTSMDFRIGKAIDVFSNKTLTK